MPSMSLSVPHQLGRDEAISRLKNESEQVKSKFGAPGERFAGDLGKTISSGSK